MAQVSEDGSLPRARLPKWLAPRGTSDLVRLGRDFDGGYLVERTSVDDADLLLSFGLNTDWSFERDFYSARGVPVHGFDGTVGRLRLLRRCVTRALNVTRPRRFLLACRIFADHVRFFRGDRHHHRLMVGQDGARAVSLDTVFKRFVRDSNQKVFLKIDVEGSEYLLLDDILCYEPRITGLAIEFHDVSHHFVEIERFVAACTSLVIAHTHINNFSGLDANDVPSAIEVTFARAGALREGASRLPHPLDMPNNQDRPDYAIAFAP